MKTYILLILLTFLFVDGYTQTQTGAAKKYLFHSINQGGLLTGDGNNNFLLQTINGIGIGKYFAGIGVGIDYYASRSVPLFIAVRKDIVFGRNTLFAYMDGGLNMPWVNSSQKNSRIWPTNYKAGGYYDAGLGWRINGKKGNGFLLSAGYSYKQVKETVSIKPFWPFEPGPNTERIEKYNSQFRRIVVKIGLQL